MSEYQYYEFAAIDEPLTEKQQRELRALSTRAEITPTSFVNEYQWGNFKGDPRKLIVDYFDAFLYYANWGTLWCMFRLPKEAIDLAALRRFVTEEAINVVGKGKWVVVDVCLDDESGEYVELYEQTLAPLIPARAALLEGDLGPLYVSWLAAAQRRLIDDDTPEPCDVSQLPEMNAGTRAMAHFLGVNDKLLKSAYKPAQKRVRLDSPQHVAKWVRSLPPSEKDEYLEQFLSEPATIVRSKLLKRYRASQAKQSRPAKTSKPANKPRTAAELLALAGLDERDDSQ